jgi:hypothetical protein
LWKWFFDISTVLIQNNYPKYPTGEKDGVMVKRLPAPKTDETNISNGSESGSRARVERINISNGGGTQPPPQQPPPHQATADDVIDAEWTASDSASSNPQPVDASNGGADGSGNGGNQQNPADSSPVTPPDVPKLEQPPVSRYLTFAVGLALTMIVTIIAGLILSRWLRFDQIFDLGLFVVMILLFYRPGLVKTAGKSATGEDIESGFVGVVKAFDAPLPELIQFTLPAGDAWLIPYFMEVAPIDIRERGVDIPPDPNDPGFGILSISKILDASGKVIGTKFVPMLAKVRIRKRTTHPYKYYNQDPLTIERTQVAVVVNTLRHIGTNGTYPGRPGFKVSSDFELMQAKHDLGFALTEDIKKVSQDEWGEGIIDVVVRELKPASAELIRRYEQVALEVADREAQTIEGDHILSLARKYQSAHGLSWEKALTYAMLSAGKTTLENIKIFGGGGAVFFKGDPNKPASPSPQT